MTRPVARHVGPVIVALFTAQLATALIPFGLGALAPVVRGRYDLTRGEVGLATTAIFVAVAILSVPMGRTADRFGVAPTLAIASGTIGVAVAAMGMAETFAVLLSCLVVVGIGYAAVTPTTNKGIVAVVPTRARGRAMGVKQMGVTAAGVAAAAFLPGSVERVGWRVTLLGAGAAIAVIGGTSSLAYAALAGTWRTWSPSGGALAVVPARRLLSLGAVVGVLVAGQAVVGTYLALFLVDRRGMDVAAAAAALTVLHASGTAARLGWGYVSDRLRGGRLRTLALIGLSSAATIASLAAIGGSVPTTGLVALLVLLGAATQGGNAVYQAALAEEDEERAGRASGIGMSIGFTGAVVAPPLFGTAVDASGYGIPLLAVAALVSAASVFTLRLARARDLSLR